MRTGTKTQRAALLLALILLALGAGPARADVTTNLNTIIDSYYATPYPGIIAGAYPPPTAPKDEKMDWVEGRIGYALACFKKGVNITAARNYLKEACTAEDPIASTGDGDACSAFFSVPALARIYLDPALSQHLDQSSKDAIEKVMWYYMVERSKTADAGGDDMWKILGTDNHDPIQKSSFLLGCLALSPAGDGYDGPLNDGHSIAFHLTCWKKYFFEYFRQRAREGLNSEINSIGYNKMTLQCWYNLADLLDTGVLNGTFDQYGNNDLADLAKQAIQLFWADYAVDFLPKCGLRGIAGTRCYKNALDDPVDGFTMLLWGYEWNKSAYNYASWKQSAFEHIALLPMLVSPYRILNAEIDPDGVVDSIGKNENRTPYLSTTRRYGKGSKDASGLFHQVRFGANHASDIVRQIYWHPRYVMGGLTLRRDLPDTDPNAYLTSIDQNRAMGVFINKFEDKTAHRVTFAGRAELPFDDNQTFTDAFGVCGTRCLIAARDKNYVSCTGNMRVNLTGDIWTNRQADSGWVFSQLSGTSSPVYVGIRIATGGYSETVNESKKGNSLDFLTPSSPVIIEVATNAEYASYTAFKDACKSAARNFNYSANKLTYTSCAGQNFEFWANTVTTLPKINGATVDLNPVFTYASPYIFGPHGIDEIFVVNGVDPTLELDFNFTKAPMWDDYQTKALWHMDTITTGKVLDDDAEAPTRNNDLTLYNSPTVVTDDPAGTGLFGMCLNLNGSNQYGQSVTQWLSYPTAKVDVWFKITDYATQTAQTVVTASNVWEIRAQNTGVLQFIMWDNQATPATPTATVAGGATAGVWHHATGTVDSAGNVNLTVDGVDATPQSSGYPMKAANATIQVGCKGAQRYLKGKLDDVKIRINNLD